MKGKFGVSPWDLLRAGRRKEILPGKRVSGVANSSPAPEDGKPEGEEVMFSLALP